MADEQDAENDHPAVGNPFRSAGSPALNSILTSDVVNYLSSTHPLGPRLATSKTPALASSIVNAAKVTYPFGNAFAGPLPAALNQQLASALAPLTRDILAPAASLQRVLGEGIMNPTLVGQLNSLIASSMPTLHIGALGALAAAARETGLEAELDDMPSAVGDLDETAVAVRAAAAREDLADVDPRDVRLGVRVVVCIVALYIVLWINTGDDEWRWAADRVLDWSGVAGTGFAVETWVRKKLPGESNESGG